VTIVLTTAHVRAIEEHAQEGYPEECCGFLIGQPGERKEVRDVRRASNVVETNRERRYVIDPREILRADREARASGHEILGFYHSHPDHPARPSTFDESHATWSGYSYVIMSIVGGNPNDLRSWVIDTEGGPFRAETLSITAL
jgi:proteasome lid subunit RPN8/RPN11